MYDPTVARLTYRALLGRRRALILFVLPALLLVIAAAVRLLTGRGVPAWVAGDREAGTDDGRRGGLTS